MLDLNNTGGTFDRQPNSTHVVSLWHIPNGGEYSSATAHNVFFSDEASAKAFEKTWEMPPEIALLTSIEQHDVIQRDIAKKQPCGECGQFKDSHIDRFDAFPGQCDTWISPDDRLSQSSTTDDQHTPHPFDVFGHEWDGQNPPPPMQHKNDEVGVKHNDTAS